MNVKKAFLEVEKNEAYIVDLLKQILAVDTSVPPGENYKKLIDIVTPEFHKFGFATEQVGRWAVISVKDNGCGVTREFMTQSLFQPFQTTKSDGLGIGLFHTKMLVEAHQGRIEVESEEGVGTTFRVLLPSSPIIEDQISNLDNQVETVPI